MSNLLIGLLAALVVTNQPAGVSTNPVAGTNSVIISIPNPNDPVEKEYTKLTADDDAAQAEVDKWIRENNAFAEKGAGIPAPALNQRILARFEPIKKAYVDFLKRHPDHARAHLAYGSFLEDNHDEDGAVVEFEKARELDPKNPAPWNQLANHYGHDGPIPKAFEYYEKAIELAPTESIYYQNLGTTVFVFRKDAGEYYKINEQQVFDKALELYQKSLKLDPNNFELAQDVAQTYYGIRPVRTDDALKAWTNALNVAETPIEKEGVYLHLARFKLNADRFAEARQNLTMVTNATYDELKARLLHNIESREKGETNATSAAVLTNQPASAVTTNK